MRSSYFEETVWNKYRLSVTHEDIAPFKREAERRVTGMVSELWDYDTKTKYSVFHYTVL